MPAAAVRSGTIAFTNAFVTGSPEGIYTCPDGITVIVKTIIYYNYASSDNDLMWGILRAGSAEVSVNGPFALPPNEGQMLQTWVTLEPGDQFTITQTEEFTSWHLSGAFLPGVAP